MALTFDDLLKEYVDLLDDWQREVDDIRKMHHEIWKESRVYPIIKQHRAGSRVEKQCRILPIGKQTDVDYKFEVTGVVVETEKRIGLYWKVSASSNAHGKIFVAKETKLELMNRPHYSDIFTENVFVWSDEEDAYLLLPGPFKENVVQMSKFEYRKDATPPLNSPSVPGQGAVNEYDIVPCLRLSQWPLTVLKWAKDVCSEHKALNKEFRSKMLKNEFLFIVAAGNPTSPEKDKEFRLSFSLLEVKCFEKLSPYLRKLYGLIKYVYKMKLESIDLLDSYHIKTLFFCMLDNKFNGKKLTCCDYLKDLLHYFDNLINACKEERVEHMFVEDCNIFPFHKINRTEKVKQLIETLDRKDKTIEDELHILLRRDLLISDSDDETWIKMAVEQIQILQTGSKKCIYINSYLTRLISLIIYSLYENKEQNNLGIAVSRMQNLFSEYPGNKNVHRMISMVNATLERLDTSNNSKITIDTSLDTCSLADNISRKVHIAFEAYLHKDFQHTLGFLQDVSPEYGRNLNESGFIGISVTSYHKDFELDDPLHYVISTLEESSKEHKCPRFYLDPVFLAQHLKIQVRLKTMDKTPDQSDFDILKNLCVCLSDREPYMGRLSYRFSAILLLQGYRQMLERYSIVFTGMDSESINSFNHRAFATNFDLR